MNILFLTLVQVDTLYIRGNYTDLLREFCNLGHHVYIVSPAERRENKKTGLIQEGNCTILRVQTGNIQKTNLLEKGLSTVLLEGQFIRAIQRYFSDICFDLVLYSTPPITVAGVVEYIKKRDHAYTYLLLKDIFPQNAVDIGILRKKGIAGFIYRYFRSKEKKLYAISDRIGCMSQANVDYLLRQDSEIDPNKVEICPNSVEPIDISITLERRNALREKYGIPQNKLVFLYGGNLGRPQGIPFIIDCLRACANREDCFFVICGSGTEYAKLEQYVDTEHPANVRLMKSLPREDYEDFVPACDVGLLFLDYRFVIPNFPSRLLSYMQAGLPVLCCTDPNTDVGDVAVAGRFGWKCLSNDAASFCQMVDAACSADRIAMGDAGKTYLRAHYTVAEGCEIILRNITKTKTRGTDHVSR